MERGQGLDSGDSDYQACQSELQTDRENPGLTRGERPEHIWTGVGRHLENI